MQYMTRKIKQLWPINKQAANTRTNSKAVAKVTIKYALKYMHS